MQLIKKRVAIFMHGGVGGGFFSQGQPNIALLVHALSLDYFITIYSQFPSNADFKPLSFKFKSAPNRIRGNWMRWIYLIGLFINDQRKEKVEVLYAFWGFPAGFLAVALGKLFKVPSMVHLQGGDVVGLPEIDYGALLNSTNRRLIKWTYKNANEVIALTHYQNQFLQTIKKRNSHIIPFGVDAQKFSFKNREISAPLRCLHVASLIPVKDQLTLLKCFKLVSQQVQAELHIVGEGKLEGQLKKECERLAILQHVQFLGFHSHLEMHKFYEWAHLLIHTSIYEGQCLAVTEAAASGVLITGTKVGLVADLGEDGCVSVEVGDYELLAKKIIDIKNNSTQWNGKVQFAKEWTENHSFEITIMKIKSILDNLNEAKMV
jgi:glycosyltransferase involved in cell wall biosynthesis